MTLEEIEKKAKEYATKNYETCLYDDLPYANDSRAREQSFKDGAEFGYRKADESHSPDEHIDKDRVVLGIIKHCNKTRYSLVQWNGEWWYQYGTYNAEVRLIVWYNIPELPKESER